VDVSIRSQHRRRENPFYANPFGIKSLPGHLRGILVCGWQVTYIPVGFAQKSHRIRRV
jgi:hypothetical protein